MGREVCGACWCPYDEDTGACGCPPPNVQKSTLREAAALALEALEYGGLLKKRQAITALRAALAEPVEPVAFKDAPERIYLQVCEDDHCEVPFHEHDEKTWCTTKQNPLDVPYVRADLTALPQRKPLTEEEIINIGKEARAVEGQHILPVTFARAIERAHGIKEQP